MMTAEIYLYRSNQASDPPGLLFLFVTIYGLLIYGILKLTHSRFFAKKSSNEWDHEALRPQRPLFYYVYWLAAMVVLSLIGDYYVISYKPIILDGEVIDDGFKYIWFYVCFILLLAGLVNSYLVKTDTSFSDYPYLRYIMKVWITTILAAPFLVSIILILKSAGAVPYYPILVVTTNGFGLSGFTAFAFNVHYLSQHNWSEHRKKGRIFAASQLLILASIIAFSLKSTIGLSWFWLWLPYALVMAFGVFYYKLDKPIPVEDAIVVED